MHITVCIFALCLCIVLLAYVLLSPHCSWYVEYILHLTFKKKFFFKSIKKIFLNIKKAMYILLHLKKKNTHKKKPDHHDWYIFVFLCV